MLSTQQSYRLSVLRSGTWITWVVVAAALPHILAAHHDHRPLVLGLLAAAVVNAGVLWSLGPRIAASRHFEAVMAGWTLGHMAATVVVCATDGGTSSPLVAVFFLSVAFAAVALSMRLLLLAVVLDVGAVLGLSLGFGGQHDGLWSGLAWVGGLVATGGVCAKIATDRRRRVEELRETEHEALRRMMRVVEYRDEDTGGHIERISEYCAILARRLGFPEDRVDELAWASTMHDVGKIAVPDAILLKPGPLTAQERSIVERHAEVGHEMLQDSESPVLALAATIALTHHERWDGAGYPRRLRAEEIPIEGRIVAVSDVFDALTSERVYKRAMSVLEAVEVIRDGRGTQFDPEIVDAFLDVLDEVVAVQHRHADAPGHHHRGRALLALEAG
ncbi:MAG TPA: HD domain-containing phosphohydrolase [Baekduia sp.]|nr:HD domain-containing phosphohydrolase [Baekduia sp.]